MDTALSDFEALCDMPFTVEADGHSFEIHQVRVHQLDRIQPLCGRILPALGMPLPDGLLGTSRPELVDFLAVATGIPRVRLADFKGEDLLAVLAAVRFINPDIFPHPEESEAPRQPGATWAELFAELVRRGHRPAEIPHYGLAQFAAYLRAVNAGPAVAPTPTKKPTLRIVQ